MLPCCCVSLSPANIEPHSSRHQIQLSEFDLTHNHTDTEICERGEKLQSFNSIDDDGGRHRRSVESSVIFTLWRRQKRRVKRKLENITKSSLTLFVQSTWHNSVECCCCCCMPNWKRRASFDLAFSSFFFHSVSKYFEKRLNVAWHNRVS